MQVRHHLRNFNNLRINKQRSSNLELYRIICMLMIVAHHFVVCSGLTAQGGPLSSGTISLNSLYLRLFGMWGKVGINCFMMITGYFMCTSQITIRKYLKLLLQIYFYNLIFYVIFSIVGYETLSINRILNLLVPIGIIKTNFTGCFLIFYLTIPFWTILVRNMTKRQHQLLLLLLLFCYSIIGSIPIFDIEYNYVSWFGIIFLIASYIRLYPIPLFNRRHFWGWTTLVLVFISMCSVAYIHWKVYAGYFFVSDCNRILAVMVAISSFLWFKNLNIPQSKFINIIAASTFGVLLIHSNSGAMMKWLWSDVFNVTGNFALPIGQVILFSICVLLLVYCACTIIDQIRLLLLEKPFFKWYDKHLDNKLNDYKNSFLCLKN